ncbi:MAG: cytochrome c biogenesis protein CcsA [Fimbriimonadaceae bacterium]|nr:cytochrome c biogenesis protein CcsA [Fimbriimonadaceae bacterium]
MIASARCLPAAAAVLLATATLLYGLVHRADRRGEARPGLLRAARCCFYLHLGGVEILAAVLLHGILTHRFDLDYIFRHSSTDLPFLYLVSTFWAGQEGTFVLWALFGGLLGAALVARSREWEASVLLVWGCLQLLVLGLVIVQPPLAPVHLEAFTALELKVIQTQFGGLPPEGQGLNPLLQNPWMAIHPPILFLGFCAMGVPYAFAMAGLLRGDLDGWTWRAQGWTLLAWTILGTGLILGGYWAYETLGWGGYWAWDPVENSSLVPWLFAGALFHGLLLQQAGRGAARQLNLALAAAACCSVTFGSYLNRSGVLSDFSVHSFVALSDAFNRALLVFATVPLLAFGLLWWRAGRRQPGAVIVAEPVSRLRLLHLVTVLLAGSGVVVLVGNSWPLLSAPFKKTALQPSFYNSVHTPYAMLLAVLLTIVMSTTWRSVRQERLLTALRWSLLLAGVCGGVSAAVLGGFLRARAATPEWLPATARPLAWAWWLLLTLCATAVLANLQALLGDLRRREVARLGTHLAHCGFMLLVIGAVVSSVFETKTILSLPLGQPLRFVGYELTYQGLQPVGENAAVRLLARHGEQQHQLAALLRPGTAGQPLRNPAILKLWSHDLYLEPGEIQAGSAPLQAVLERGRAVSVADLKISFAGFDLGAHEQTADRIRVGIRLQVSRGGQTTPVTAWFAVVGGEVASEPAELPGGGQVTVVDMPPKEDGSGDRVMLLHLTGVGSARPETAVLQTTIKPGMTVVWLGCWLTMLGGALAAARRARLAVRLALRRERPRG